MPKKTRRSLTPIVKTPSRSPSNSPGPKSKKTPLSETQKKRNHIDSEKNRRNAIEAAFVTLSLIVPNAQQLAKSENKLLAKSLKWAKDLLEERDRLHRIAKMSGIETAA